MQGYDTMAGGPKNNTTQTGGRGDTIPSAKTERNGDGQKGGRHHRGEGTQRERRTTPVGRPKNRRAKAATTRPTVTRYAKAAL